VTTKAGFNLQARPRATSVVAALDWLASQGAPRQTGGGAAHG
jgi:hypothetical protein